MATSLLTTKLYFPPARQNLVRRPRLLERLNSGLKKPLTLISAPPGSGKTSLMSEWRMENGSRISAAWLSLDEGDNDPSRFWSYLVASLGTLQYSSFDATQGLLHSPQPISLETIGSSVVHELESFPNDHVLVLDDLHVITSSVIQQALIFLLDHLPPKSHLVILTRADPALPISRMRVRDQLTELRAADLRFTLDEVKTFLSETMGLSLTPEQIVSLETRTEGWIAGLQLAALSMHGRGSVEDFIAAFAGSHHYVVDYLIEEVLNLQSEKMRDFLLKTSILERMNASLCNALTGASNSQSTLEELEQANLFVVKLDDERQWYRYHHLFRDVLQIRLQQSDPDRTVELHRCAAEWLEQNKLLTDAVHHALAGGDKERAGRLAEKIDAQMLARGELIALLGWLETVKELVTERPFLGLDKAWALMLTGQIEGVESLLEHVENLISKRAQDEDIVHIRGNVAAIRSYMASRNGDATRGIELGQQALEIFQENNPGVRGVVHMAMGGAHILRGDLKAALESMQEAGRLGKLAENLHVAVTALSSVANILMAQGQLHKSEETYREALQLAILPGGRILPVAGRVYSGLCRLFYEWNDLDTAYQYALKTSEFGQKWGNADSLVTAHTMLARIHQAWNDMGNAEENMRTAEHLVQIRQLTPTSVESVETARIGFWLAQENIEACNNWLRARGLVKNGKQSKSAGKRLIRARILLALGDSAAALKTLTQLAKESELAGQWNSVIESLELQALAFQQKGDLATALKTLERALLLAEHEGYVRIFLDQGRPMERLLKKMKVQSTSLGTYIGRLVASFNSTDSHSSVSSITAPQLLINRLSERELEILRLVARGRSNQEIAAELYLAVGTVKKHLSNIFGKLNVDSRTRCIARARELHLIE